MKGNSFTQYRFLLIELVKKGIKLKYRRSYLGIIWSLIEPVLTTIVLVIVFGTIFENKNLTYPLYIITGRLIYSGFSTGTKSASKAIRANASMIKKVYVPKYLYPLSSVIYNYVIFVISLLSLFGVAVYCNVVPTLRIWGMLPAMVILFVLTTGVSFILCTLHVFFRDIEYLWNVLLTLIMYMSAIFYYPEKLEKSRFGFILEKNPLYCIIEMTRNALLSEPFNLNGFIYASVFALVTLIIGIYFFNREQDKFILHI